MAKIGFYSITGNGYRYEQPVYYSTQNEFYILIPDELLDKCSALNSDDKSKFNLKLGHKRQLYNKYYVWASTEAGVKALWSNLIHSLANTAKVLEPVILIEYRTEFISYTLPSNDLCSDLALNIVYANRCTIGSAKPTYQDDNGRTLQFYGRKIVTIPDRPEYREKLENLVLMLKRGNDILADIFSESSTTLEALERSESNLLPLN